MIKFEHNTLVLNSILSKDDVAEINAFADYIRKQEQERIIKLLENEIATCEENNLDEHGCREFDWETYWDVRITEFKTVIALIKGENK